MPEIDALTLTLPMTPPLDPPDVLITRQAYAMMDGYSPMTGRVGVELCYLVRDCDSEFVMPSAILEALRGVVYECEPEPDLIHVHTHADGYLNSLVVVRVWQEARQ